jgi:ABC-type multidrug transport system fused ATPase/permease subunit
LFDTLIFAPRSIRAEAEQQAATLLLTIAILISTGVAYFFHPDPATRALISAVFLIILMVKLFRGLNFDRAAPPRNGAGLLFLLVVLPIVGPMVLGYLAPALPNLERFEFGRTLLISIAILLAAHGLFFVSLLKHLPPRPTVHVACAQRALSINANPAKLFEELERTLQERWTEKIPNRRYDLNRIPDMVSGQSGSFEADILEETQPIPVNAEAQTIAEKLQTGANRYVAALTGLSLAAFLAATLLALRIVLTPIGAASLTSDFVLVAVLLATAVYCWKCGHLLWGRVDFTSLLLWVEVRGSYEESQNSLGNQMTASMSTTKKFFNVESMTLRVWAAELDTVIFHKNGPRDVIGMRGRPDMAQYYADHLEQFGRNIASVVAPSSNADLERIARMAQAQQMLGKQCRRRRRARGPAKRYAGTALHQPRLR